MRIAPKKNKRTWYKRDNHTDRLMYGQQRWKRLRQWVIERDNGLCQQCGTNGLIQPGDEVDHIQSVRRRPDLKYEPTNLQTLCKTCHQQKTAKGC